MDDWLWPEERVRWLLAYNCLLQSVICDISWLVDTAAMVSWNLRPRLVINHISLANPLPSYAESLTKQQDEENPQKHFMPDCVYRSV